MCTGMNGSVMTDDHWPVVFCAQIKGALANAAIHKVNTIVAREIFRQGVQRDMVHQLEGSGVVQHRPGDGRMLRMVARLALFFRRYFGFREYKRNFRE